MAVPALSRPRLRSLPPRQHLVPMIASTRTPLMHRLAGDDVLAARAGHGDDLAFAALVRRVQPRLVAYCATLLGNAQDADDAVQNTFIKALAGLRAGEGVRAVRPWLYRIAHNEAISLMRRRRPATELVATVADHAHGPAETVAVREEMRAVLDAIGALPDRSRDAFLLREVGGMRHAEVAQVLGTSPGTARQAVFEARVALQDDRAGRDASCQAIREEISARERRRASRTVRGHLRSCTSCREWSDAQSRRRKVLGITPGAGLPLAGAGGLWAWIAGVAGGGAATGGATAKIVASVAAVAALAPVGVGTLERAAHRHDRDAAAAPALPRRTTATRPAPAAPTRRQAPVATPCAGDVRAGGRPAAQCEPDQRVLGAGPRTQRPARAGALPVGAALTPPRRRRQSLGPAGRAPRRRRVAAHRRRRGPRASGCPDGRRPRHALAGRARGARGRPRVALPRRGRERRRAACGDGRGARAGRSAGAGACARGAGADRDRRTGGHPARRARDDRARRTCGLTLGSVAAACPTRPIFAATTPRPTSGCARRRSRPPRTRRCSPAPPTASSPRSSRPSPRRATRASRRAPSRSPHRTARRRWPWATAAPPSPMRSRRTRSSSTRPCPTTPIAWRCILASRWSRQRSRRRRRRARAARRCCAPSSAATRSRAGWRTRCCPSSPSAASASPLRSRRPRPRRRSRCSTMCPWRRPSRRCASRAGRPAAACVRSTPSGRDGPCSPRWPRSPG